SSYGAYTVLLLALVLFAVGIVGNLAVMCIVWHSYYLKSAWNSILASLALWDFLEQREGQLSSTVVGLTAVYALCTLPENVCNVVAAYLSATLTRQTLDLLGLVGQFSTFLKAAVTPVLLLCVCRPLGRAFLDCCCCCCCEGCGGAAATDGPDAKLQTGLSTSVYFHKPREAPPLLALGTPC
ncbi:hypothetical protein E2I00_010386, partial [Balaenoptera physalus]